MKSKKTINKSLEEPIVYGNPVYGEEKDIYSKEKKLTLTEPGDASDNNFDHEMNPGADLDVPGAELDDADEIIGSEDEENNYYSIGGDDHEDLEEDKDEE